MNRETIVAVRRTGLSFSSLFIGMWCEPWPWTQRLAAVVEFQFPLHRDVVWVSTTVPNGAHWRLLFQFPLHRDVVWVRSPSIRKYKLFKGLDGRFFRNSSLCIKTRDLCETFLPFLT